VLDHPAAEGGDVVGGDGCQLSLPNAVVGALRVERAVEPLCAGIAAESRVSARSACPPS
jgi:hypothetical protein